MEYNDRNNGVWSRWARARGQSRWYGSHNNKIILDPHVPHTSAVYARVSLERGAPSAVAGVSGAAGPAPAASNLAR